MNVKIVDKDNIEVNSFELNITNQDILICKVNIKCEPKNLSKFAIDIGDLFTKPNKKDSPKILVLPEYVDINILKVREGTNDI